MDEQKVAELNRMIRESKHIVFFGGAGLRAVFPTSGARTAFITSTMSNSTGTVRNTS